MKYAAVYLVLFLSGSQKSSACPVPSVPGANLSPQSLLRAALCPPGKASARLQLPICKPLPPYLRKRMMRGLRLPPKITVHLAHYQTIAFITPVTIAAQKLERFYSEVVTLASTVWSSEPELREFCWRQGGFRLNFRSVGDTIPWSFVSRIAERLLQAAGLQLTEVFEMIYVDDLQSIRVKVWLEIV